MRTRHCCFRQTLCNDSCNRLTSSHSISCETRDLTRDPCAVCQAEGGSDDEEEDEAGVEGERAKEAELEESTPASTAPKTPKTPADDGGSVNAEMRRLLRAPRYFDEDFEAAAIRCFHCGGSGHMAYQCTNERKRKPCFLCGSLEHQRNVRPHTGASSPTPARSRRPRHPHRSNRSMTTNNMQILRATSPAFRSCSVESARPYPIRD